jgi:two-component system chemotaxis response regulator CheY
MRVLIAEDDTASRLYLKEVILPYALVREAATGIEAVEAFKQSLEDDAPFDLILLDIVMPEMDGLRALETIRGIEKERGMSGDNAVKVLMISSLDDPKNMNRAFFQGQALDFISKPVTREELLDVLAKFGLIAT